MVKKFSILLLAPAIYLISATPAFAQMDWSGCAPGGIATLNCIPVVFNNVVNWALIFSGAVALFLVILSGVRYIRSGGDQEKIKGAREVLTYAIIGLIIIFLSFAIINLISYVTKVDCIKQFGFTNCQ